MSVSLMQQLTLVASAPNGIKKLRELILDLAVRGKLLPQDQSDEPASELLKQIAAEKKRLVAEGKIKRSNAPEEIAREVLYPIPPTWTTAALGEVVEIVRGITFPASEKSKTPEAGRVACLRTSNVQKEIEWDDLLYIREEFVSRPDQYVRPHDIVMSMANSRELVGKVALVRGELEQKTTFGGFLGVLRPILIAPRFVMASLRTPQARRSLIDSASQTTNIANVSLGKLRPFTLAIPPLAEQERIVAKIDELMGLCDRLEAQQADAESAHELLVKALLKSLTQARDADDFAASWQLLSDHFHTLFTSEASVDALKQSLLQLAVMGRLVAQNAEDDVIELSRAEQGEAGEREAALRNREVSSQFPLPEGWRWVRLEDLGLVGSSSRVLKQDWRESGVPFYRAREIVRLSKNGHVSSELFISEDLFHQLSQRGQVPESGDVMLTGVGTIGVPYLVRPRDRFYFKDASVLIFKPRFAGISEYLMRFFASPLWIDTIHQESMGTTVHTLTISRARETLCPLPPLGEQRRIVAKLDELMALCDQMKSRLIEARQLNEQLANTLVEFAVV